MQSIYWLCFFLGIILYVFYLTNAHTLDFANTNNVMIDFLINYCPHGLLGILLAAMFSAAMSSIAAVINSMSAVFIRDIYEPYISKKPNTPLSKSILFFVYFRYRCYYFRISLSGGQHCFDSIDYWQIHRPHCLYSNRHHAV